MCEALGVSRGDFYAWLTRHRSRRSLSDEVLGAQVHQRFVRSDRTYGARRVWHDHDQLGLFGPFIPVRRPGRQWVGCAVGAPFAREGNPV